MHVIKIARRYRFNILYTRNSSIGIIGFFIIMMYGSKLALELNGLFSEDWMLEKKLNGRTSTFKNFKIKLLDWMEIFASKKADAVVVVAQGIKDILIQRGVKKDKIVVVSNGANIDIFKPLNNSEVFDELRQQYNINTNDYIIVFVGNFESYHGIDYLIRSAPRVLNSFPNTKFLIVGDGAVKDELSQLSKKIGVASEIIFTGRISYEKIPLYINLSDICVAPFIRARNERLGLSPLKIFEYLACEKPVISSDVGGIGNILRDSNSGISILPGDPNELAEAIIKLLKDKKLREQMGKNGREIVINNYSWKNTAMRIVEVFEKLLR